MDAANIDLKALDDRVLPQGDRRILEEVKTIHHAGRRPHPSRGDHPGDPGEERRPAADRGDRAASLPPWIRDIPLHLSAYHPDYKYDDPPTPPQSVRDLAAVARRHLRFVYVGNLGAGGIQHRLPFVRARPGAAPGLLPCGWWESRTGACAKCGQPPFRSWGPCSGLSAGAPRRARAPPLPRHALDTKLVFVVS